jgi:hypothetical protein
LRTDVSNGAGIHDSAFGGEDPTMSMSGFINS